MEHILKELGLTHLEIKLYKFLLLDGPNHAGLISRKTGVHRRNVYDALERLIQKGLVSYIKENNIKQYIPSDPEIVHEKLLQKEQEWKQLLPGLKKQITQWNEKKETVFFRGKNAVKNIFLDQIKVGEEILVNATSKDVESIIKYFFPKYQLLRKEKKIKTRMIVDSEFKKTSNANSLKKLPLCSVKYIKDFNSTYTSEYIYGDTVAIVIWDENPSAIVIRQKEIAKAYKEKFELMWRI